MEMALAIVAALAAGATAKAAEVGGKALVDAYDGLKQLLVEKYKASTTSRLESKPESDAARMSAAEELQESGADKDPEVARLAEEVTAAIREVPPADQARLGIDVSDIRAKLDIAIRNLEADDGGIAVKGVTSEQGGVTIEGLSSKKKK